MLFNSLHFLIFFPVVVALYFAIPHRHRWPLLLVASYYFYMSWKAEYAVLIVASTLIDYFAGLRMGRIPDRKGRRPYLALSLLVNLGLLFSFKYFEFFSDNLRMMLNQFNIFYDQPAYSLLLPVGISFYTFQTLSYSIDVYRGKQKPERHFGIFAVYVSFFPQLVAGPIERPSNLLPQFMREHHFDYARVTAGLKLMLWGFFKKVVVADRLALLVDPVYSEPEKYAGAPLVIATVFFAFQIYCDFSGYSDIAIGSAKVMGFDLMQNFRRPYFAKSIGEFWHRWHISLSTWFRDYVYIPLGGNRVASSRLYINAMITFVVSGLWHGANWTFVVWGALHGTYIMFEMMTKDLRPRLSHQIGLDRFPALEKWLEVGTVFVLVCFAWIFFRADSLGDAWFIITHIFGDVGSYLQPGYLELQFRGMGVTRIDLLHAFAAIGLLVLFELVERRKGVWTRLQERPIWVRWSFYYALLILCVFYAPYNRAQNFIYFQF